MDMMCMGRMNAGGQHLDEMQAAAAELRFHWKKGAEGPPAAGPGLLCALPSASPSGGAVSPMAICPGDRSADCSYMKSGR